MEWIWGPLLLLGTGLFLTFRLGGLQFRGLPHALKLLGHKGSGRGEISPFQALTTSLAGTIGTGNIAGVATALVLGGVGSLFWMWIAGVFGMALSYGESLLSVYFRKEEGRTVGGPMYTLERGLGWRPLAIAYAIFGLMAALGIGSTVQVHSIADICATTFSVPPLVTGLVMMALVGLVVIGGVRAIGRVTMVVVPVMALFYVTGGLVVIAINWQKIPGAFGHIIQSAFTFKAAGGGLLVGVARGMFSNEAGMGSASIAAAAAKTDSAPRQALISMTGTFFDTIVCTITGLVLVISGISGLNGAPLTAAAFDAYLPGGGLVVTIGLILFAYSTILAWAYYGETCFEYLRGSARVFRLCFVSLIFLGALLPLQVVWIFADIANGLMAIPNLITILALQGLIVAQTRGYWEKRFA